MPPKKSAKSSPKPNGKAGVDVFSRMPPDLVAKLDSLAEKQRRSRSLMVMLIVEEYVEREYPKVETTAGNGEK